MGYAPEWQRKLHKPTGVASQSFSNTGNPFHGSGKTGAPKPKRKLLKMADGGPVRGKYSKNIWDYETPYTEENAVPKLHERMEKARERAGEEERFDRVGRQSADRAKRMDAMSAEGESEKVRFDRAARNAQSSAAYPLRKVASAADDGMGLPAVSRRTPSVSGGKRTTAPPKASAKPAPKPAAKPVATMPRDAMSDEDPGGAPASKPANRASESSPAKTESKPAKRASVPVTIPKESSSYSMRGLNRNRQDRGREPEERREREPSRSSLGALNRNAQDRSGNTPRKAEPTPASAPLSPGLSARYKARELAAARADLERYPKGSNGYAKALRKVRQLTGE